MIHIMFSGLVNYECNVHLFTEPVIELSKLQIITDESSGTVSVPLTRSGDVSEAMIVLCSTKSQTAIGSSGNRLDSGTDFISQSDMIVKFKAGEKTAACEIRVCALLKLQPFNTLHLLHCFNLIHTYIHLLRTFQERSQAFSCRPLLYILQIIDDTLFEGREEFEVSISNPSEPAKLGLLTTSTVIIAGPNDGKCYNLTL